MSILLWPLIFLALGATLTLVVLQLLVYLDGNRPKHRKSIFAKREKYRPKHACEAPLTKDIFARRIESPMWRSEPLKQGWKAGIRQGKQMSKEKV